MADETSEYVDRIVDETALAEFLTDELGSVSNFSVTYHSAGHSNETLFVDWGGSDLVIRRPPPGSTADTAHDMLREYEVVDALQNTDVPVPSTVAACRDHSVLGCDFFIMERLNGDVLRDTEPSRFSNPDHRRTLGEEFVGTLAKIHSLDYRSLGLDDFGRPDGFPQRQVERWQQQFDWALERTEEVRPLPDIDHVNSWLTDNTPQDFTPTLVHGDYKLDNVLFAPSTPPKLVGVLDWEMSTLGDPGFDLGWTLAYWHDLNDHEPPSAGEFHTFMSGEGYPTRRELVDEYERQTGIEFDNQQFYRAFGVYKAASACEMFFRRHLEGNANDPSYAKMDDAVPEMLSRVQRIIAGDEPL